MGEVLPLPERGETFIDARGEGRSLRVSWHSGGEDVLVISLWFGKVCRATFRMPREEVAALIGVLAKELATHGPEVDIGAAPVTAAFPRVPVEE